jgi:peptide subunit release factor 1 (eRF1)
MTTRVEQIAEQVKSLPLSEREELLAWLADFELGQVDAWDEEIARDSQPGGQMQRVLDRVRRDIAEGRAKPLGEVIDNE